MKRRDFLNMSALGATPLFLMPGLFAQKDKTRQVKIAICGLGRYAENQIAPAIEDSEFASLTAIITGSNEKIPKWLPIFSHSSSEEISINVLNHVIQYL